MVTVIWHIYCSNFSITVCDAPYFRWILLTLHLTLPNQARPPGKGLPTTRLSLLLTTVLTPRTYYCDRIVAARREICTAWSSNSWYVIGRSAWLEGVQVQNQPGNLDRLFKPWELRRNFASLATPGKAITCIEKTDVPAPSPSPFLANSSAFQYILFENLRTHGGQILVNIDSSAYSWWRRGHAKHIGPLNRRGIGGTSIVLRQWYIWKQPIANGVRWAILANSLTCSSVKTTGASSLKDADSFKELGRASWLEISSFSSGGAIGGEEVAVKGTWLVDRPDNARGGWL